MPDEIKPAPKKHYLILFTLLIIVAGVAWFLYWLLYLQYYESTDDAYANGNFITINAAVKGSVVAYYADDTDLVEEGQLLVLLDDTPYKMAFERELAALAKISLDVRQLYDNIPIKEAYLNTKETALSRAKYDFENRSRLIGTKAISGEDFTHAQDAYASSHYQFEMAKSELQSAFDAVGQAAPENHPRIVEQKAKVMTAYYDLCRTKIYAPSTGYIAKRAVEVGEFADTNSPLMVVIPIDYVWVDANFKETQLSYMRIGQPASIWFDIYGSRVKFTGKVLGIASGTGSTFSIIPPQNATGNWIKIVQRLPVRISIDPETLQKYPLRIGISANVDVNITDKDLPMLAVSPTKKAVGVTNVFSIDLKPVEQLIETIIKENLK